MAEVSFDTLEALDRVPVSSVDGTTVSGYHRWVTVHGPIKIEWNFYQQGADDDFAAEDSFMSGLAKPIVAMANVVNGDPGAIEDNVGATLEGVESSATYRTVTVHDAAQLNGAGCLIMVIGY